MKELPSFDDFDMKQAEPVLFGNESTDARHFTSFSLKHTTNNQYAEIDDDLKNILI